MSIVIACVCWKQWNELLKECLDSQVEKASDRPQFLGGVLGEIASSFMVEVGPAMWRLVFTRPAALLDTGGYTVGSSWRGRA